MVYPFIVRLLIGAVACPHEGVDAEWSRAAQLVALGVRLSCDTDVTEARAEEGAFLVRSGTPLRGRADARALRVPPRHGTSTSRGCAVSLCAG